jgi:hypothetical protein
MNGAARMRQVQRPLWQVFLTGALKMLGCCALGGCLPLAGTWLFPLPVPLTPGAELRRLLVVSAFAFVGAVFGLAAGYFWAFPVPPRRGGPEGGPDTFRRRERRTHVSEGPLRIVPRQRP